MKTRRAFLAYLHALVCALVLIVSLSLNGCSAPAKTNDTGSVGSSSHATAIVSDATAPQDQEVTIRLAMVGDVLVHRPVWESGQQADGTYQYDHLFVQVAPDIQAADVALVNQETVLGGTELGLSSYPTFNSPQEVGDAEAAAGFDVICKATNHTVDKGTAGIGNELAFWRERHPGVAVVGAADSQETYDTIYVYEKDGFKVAILNYAYGTNGIPLPADNPWAVHLLDENAIRADVARAQELADLVVVSPHWGTEYVAGPDAMQQQYADLFCELGVDVVIGTHPHCLGPVEVRTRADGHQTLIYYSLGNFVSAQNQQELTAVGGLAEVTLVKDAEGARVADYELWPTVTHMAAGTSYTTYKLADYTDELAAQNRAGITRQGCEDLCASVLGSSYDATESVLRGTVS